jgi:hypothetical protein
MGMGVGMGGSYRKILIDNNVEGVGLPCLQVELPMTRSAAHLVGRVMCRHQVD